MEPKKPIDANEIIQSGGRVVKKRRKNYHFSNKAELPFDYRSAYLKWVDLVAPEVKNELFSLVPLRNSVFGEKLHPRSRVLTDWICTDNRSQDRPHDKEGRLELVGVLLHLTGERRYLEIDDGQLTTSELGLINRLLDLRTRFQALIEKYSFGTDWLKNDLFELLNKHAINPAKYNRLSLAHSFTYFIKSGEQFSFEFEGWSVGQESNAYREAVESSFRTRLDEYIESTAKSFREQGYRHRKARKFDRVKWLVHWNVKRTSKARILELIMKEQPSTRTVENLNEEFREMETKYGLPYRRDRVKSGKSLPPDVPKINRYN